MRTERGRVAASCQRQTTYGYDAHGRPSITTDARNGITFTTFNGADLTSTVTTPMGEVTESYYDSSLRPTVTQLPDDTFTTNVYSPTSQVKLNYGSREYPVGNGFDAQNRVTSLTNWTTFPSVGSRVTTWNYDQYRGWLNSKVYDDGKGTAYTYTDGGRLNSRSWARGTNTAYGYNAAGDLATVIYNDGLTTGLTNSFDRLGRKSSVVQGPTTTTLAYNDAGQVIMETNSGGPLAGIAVVNTYDSLLRRTGVAVVLSNTTLTTTTYGYDNASRLASVTDGTNSATYSYLANSPLVSQIGFKHNGITEMTTTKQYDYLDRLTSISSVPTGAGQYLVSFAYGYNAANQRTNRTDGDGPHWAFGYDSLGQVTVGKKYWADNLPVPGEQFAYNFDDIGNRNYTLSGGNASGGNLRSNSYSVNDLNQYTSQTVTNGFDVLGIANFLANVSVNGSTTDYRRGEFYQKGLTVTNNSAPVWLAVTNTATYSGSSSNVVGSWFIPKTPENSTFDLDGNQTSDGRFTNCWDAENRLLTVSNIASIGTSGQYLVNFTYDYQGRRIEKVAYTNNGSSWIASYTNKFVWDGWNVVAILDGGNNLSDSFNWGSDLSGSTQGAGGVGGLISMTVYGGTNGGTYFYCYDGNGNVMALVNAANGSIAAQYEYGPFGELLRATGPMAFVNPFRFSTKYQDDETGLLYYGYRFYNPSTGRWPSRDPMGEEGFSSETDALGTDIDPNGDEDAVNPYSFVQNQPINSVDLFGLQTCNLCGPNVTTPLTTLLAKVNTVWNSWTRAQQKAACKGFTSFKKDPARGNQRAFLNAWDIDQLHYQSWINSSPYSPPCATPQSVCRNTVQVGKQCYYAGSVNYVLFGHECKLCKIAKWEMDSLIWLYKGPGPIHSGSPNYGPSRDWANAGYDGWPSGGTPPAGDRPNCKPGCPVPYSGPAFKFYWYPNGWN